MNAPVCNASLELRFLTEQWF